jgi:hypothetical protein
MENIGRNMYFSLDPMTAFKMGKLFLYGHHSLRANLENIL